MEYDGGFLNLVRVLPAPPHAEDGVKLLTLELYDGGFIVRWVLPEGITTKDAGLNPQGLAALTIHDDLGTNYEVVGMSGGGHGLTLFKPAIPPFAAWLEVLTKAGTVRFDL